MRAGLLASVFASFAVIAVSHIHKLRSVHPVRTRIAVLPLGRPSRATLNRVEAALRRTFNVEAVELPAAPLPASAFYAPRQRYRAEKLTAYLSRWPDWKVIGVTDRDISTTVHGVKDFGIMGRADLGGKACVVSSFRSHAGIGNVAIHEVGHTLGLPHCPNPNCVMVDANGSGKITQASRKFCPTCASKIRQWLR
jgi:archaemetzincin